MIVTRSARALTSTSWMNRSFGARNWMADYRNGRADVQWEGGKHAQRDRLPLRAIWATGQPGTPRDPRSRSSTERSRPCRPARDLADRDLLDAVEHLVNSSPADEPAPLAATVRTLGILLDDVVQPSPPAAERAVEHRAFPTSLAGRHR